MGKSIPFLSAKDINKFEDYERFRNTKVYLLQCSGPISRAFVDKDKVWELAASVSYKKFNKFLSHQKEWHALTRKIPVKYLDAIGVVYEVLDFTVELDKDEYARALRVPLHPQGFTVRYSPCCYKTINFLPETPGQEAIRLVQQYARREGKECAINYPDIKTILVGTEGQTRTVYYEPNVHFENGYMVAANDGQNFAKVRSR